VVLDSGWLPTYPYPYPCHDFLAPLGLDDFHHSPGVSGSWRVILCEPQCPLWSQRLAARVI